MVTAWIGWIVALAAIAAAAWLWRELGVERAHTNELVCAKIEVDDELDVLRTQQAARGDAGPSFAAVGAQLDAPLGSVRTHMERASSQLEDYRGLVKRFDEAVQYCLQPVELIFGADKAGLAELVRHVEGARRKLFEARGALEKNPMHNGNGALGVGLGDVHDLAAFVRSLQAPPVVVLPDPHADDEADEPPPERPNHGNPMLG